jgi:hypothetical protein
LKHAGFDTARISHEILEYLLQNPAAQDTMDGILQWWLLEQRIRNNAALIREALAILVSKDLVLERQGTDMRTYFRINRSKSHEISVFLERELPGSGEPEVDISGVELP